MSTARIRLVLVAGLLSAVLAVAALLSGVFGDLEHTTVDQRFRVRGAEPERQLVVVAVDDVTFSELGEAWPLPRSLYGKAVDELHDAGAREIVLDVQFTEPTEEREDMALYEAIERAGGAVMATTESDGHGHTNVLGGDENLAAIGAQAGASNLPGEREGVLRRFAHDVVGLKTLAVVVAERQGRPVDEGRFPADGAYIDFAGPPGTVPTYSLSALLAGDVPASALRGKTVVIGAGAPTLQDQQVTAASDEPMSGPEIQANAISTQLRDQPLRDAPILLGVLATALMAFMLPLLALRLRPLLAALAGPVIGIAYVGIAQLAFNGGMVLPVVAPLFGLAFATVATVAASHLLETLARQRMGVRNVELRQEVADAELEIIERLGRAVESRDEETGDHIDRIGDLAHSLGLAAGLDVETAERLRRASAMHDVGKVAIPDSILRKPGRLTDEERAVMQTHTTIGAGLLAGSRSPLVQMAEVIALTHHERWDGSGYPNGIAGEDIPFMGRITAICDVFDALISPRVYKNAWTVEDALDEIERESGHHFDPELATLFLALHRGAATESGRLRQLV
ncbi:CHASE2 domain-containing protein [Solirubrobacter phytolaccae]|uniref:CHASE2 domain-containing protein n=1 Tax=Solirubrobacter phytolaccae TaxID=1404360 RepID=A0A9X3SD20_9ACTN|nr:CHASE2 domain-containing protein [Solirubrobacter phytolaccae]MDA0183170.1 CHASE2 domain-containing protein [Solirubrobacter phytolaccae]